MSFQEDEDEEAEVPSETEAGEEDEVDVCAVERIPALCSRYMAQTTPFFYNVRITRALIGCVVFLNKKVKTVMKCHCILIKLFYNKAENGCLLFTLPDPNTESLREFNRNLCKSKNGSLLQLLVNILVLLFECLAQIVLCCSDEENDEDLDSIYYLPVAPEVDDPEETGWTQEVC